MALWLLPFKIIPEHDPRFQPGYPLPPSLPPILDSLHSLVVTNDDVEIHVQQRCWQSVTCHHRTCVPSTWTPWPTKTHALASAAPSLFLFFSFPSFLSFSFIFLLCLIILNIFLILFSIIVVRCVLNVSHRSHTGS